MEAIFVGGIFASKEIILDDEHTLINADQKETEGRYGCDDGMLIKYNQDGEVEWATSVGGENSEEITCVTETSDGGYICRRIL